MKILGIESSSLVASAALTEDGVVLAEYTLNYKKTHSQTLLPMIDEIVKMTELDLHQLDAIAAAGGPGSFTGLRIGTSTAKGLGLALNKPLIHVPTVDAMAYNLWGCADLICPIMDARRGQVYTGIYRCREELETVKSQCAMDMRDLAETLNAMGEPVVFLGDGVPVFKGQIEETVKVPFRFAPAQSSRQRAASVAALGEIYFRQGKTVSAAEFRPDYLRKSQAERERDAAVQAEVTVRTMTEADLDAAAELEIQCFFDPWSRKLLKESLDNAYDVLLAAEKGGVFCGYAVLRVLAGEGEIQRIAVHPSWRRMGVGRKLMEAMEACAAKQGAPDLILEVRAGNEAALGLYQSYGFVQEGLRRGYYRNPEEDAILMRRRGS